jgi:hypothetical protein
MAQAIFGNPNRIEFKAITQAQRIPVILNGEADLVIDSMDITCARLKYVDFSTDNSVLAGLAAQDPQTKLVGPLFTFEPHGIGISKKAPGGLCKNPSTELPAIRIMPDNWPNF